MPSQTLPSLGEQHNVPISRHLPAVPGSSVSPRACAKLRIFLWRGHSCVHTCERRGGLSWGCSLCWGGRLGPTRVPKPQDLHRGAEVLVCLGAQGHVPESEVEPCTHYLWDSAGYNVGAPFEVLNRCEYFHFALGSSDLGSLLAMGIRGSGSVPTSCTGSWGRCSSCSHLPCVSPCISMVWGLLPSGCQRQTTVAAVSTGLRGHPYYVT